MDFSALPPEVNSGWIYAGPGTAPLSTTAAAWRRVAGELSASAAASRSVLTELATTSWQGAAAARMIDAAEGYIRWLHTTAAGAEATAAGVDRAAQAYQTALATTVPPAVVAGNRAQLTALITGNFFGQNTPAIAHTEAAYEHMWAQDAVAMHRYSAAAATATNLRSFITPPAVASGTAVASTPAAPTAGDPTSALSFLLQIPSLTSAAASTSSSSFSGASIGTTNHALWINAMRDHAQGIGPFLGGSTTLNPLSDTASTAGFTERPVVRTPVRAATGRASVMSSLSVPQAWTAVERAPSPARPAIPAAGVAATPPAAPLPPASGVLGEAMLGTLAGRGVGDAAAQRRRPRVVPHSPAAG